MCTIDFVFYNRLQKTVPETTVASPPVRIPRSTLAGALRAPGAALELSLQARTRRPGAQGRSMCCPPAGQAPASRSLPAPPGLAGQGSADAKCSRPSLACSLWLWSVGPAPGSLLSGEETHRAGGGGGVRVFSPAPRWLTGLGLPPGPPPQAK